MEPEVSSHTRSHPCSSLSDVVGKWHGESNNGPIGQQAASEVASQCHSMGFRFRRSVRLLPGVHLNFSRSGASLSLGRRGATVNLSRRGVRETVGIPGTGLSYSRFRPATKSREILPEAAGREAVSDIDFKRLGIAPRRARTLLVSSGAVIAAASLLSSFVNVSRAASGPVELSGLQSDAPLAVLPAFFLVLSGLMLPSRTTLFRRELARRRAEFDRAAHAIDLTNLAQLDAVLHLKERSKLLDSEVDLTQLMLLRGYREVLTFKNAVMKNGGHLPIIGGHEAQLEDGELCYFAGVAEIEGRGTHGSGTLLITNTRLLFCGASPTTLPWSKLTTFDLAGTSLRTQRIDRQTPIVFYLQSVDDVLKAHLIGNSVRHAGSEPATDRRAHISGQSSATVH